MPLPESARDLPTDVAAVGVELAAVDTALAGLPGTPLEADLPDIVQIVADLSTASTNLQAIVTTITNILSTTRINQ